MFSSGGETPPNSPYLRATPPGIRRVFGELRSARLCLGLLSALLTMWFDVAGRQVENTQSASRGRRWGSPSALAGDRAVGCTPADRPGFLSACFHAGCGSSLWVPPLMGTFPRIRSGLPRRAEGGRAQGAGGHRSLEGPGSSLGRAQLARETNLEGRWASRPRPQLAGPEGSA